MLYLQLLENATMLNPAALVIGDCFDLLQDLRDCHINHKTVRVSCPLYLLLMTKLFNSVSDSAQVSTMPHILAFTASWAIIPKHHFLHRTQEQPLPQEAGTDDCECGHT
jgi:hypothetical protein